jgi:hypothetical protein
VIWQDLPPPNIFGANSYDFSKLVWPSKTVFAGLSKSVLETVSNVSEI